MFWKAFEVKRVLPICRREGISENLYYRRSKDFLEAGKKRLMGDTAREASSEEVIDLKKENAQLKQLVAEIALKNRVPVDDRLVAGLIDIELGF